MNDLLRCWRRSDRKDYTLRTVDVELHHAVAESVETEAAISEPTEEVTAAVESVESQDQASESETPSQLESGW